MSEIELLTAYRQEMHKIQIKNGFTDEQMTSYRQGFMDAIKEYEQRISADVQSVRRGEWEKKSSVGVFRCSLCQHIFMLGADEIDEYHFCPHCGADMRNDSNLMKNIS